MFQSKSAMAQLLALTSVASSLMTSPAVAGESGVTTGVASFHARGEMRDFKSGVAVWTGTFVGTSLSDMKRGPLHAVGWECTGESVLSEGNVLRSGGFCLLTDPQGDTVNVMWERTNVPGPFDDAKTRGTYVSGTGKFHGIQGHYTFACVKGGVVCAITGGDYRIP
ncbi:MAG: hypothetical protein JNL33_08425 [Betaproteobacteria bacterium]|nr:hypothetical protein [Betaproteobacteria bacterium]